MIFLGPTALTKQVLGLAVDEADRLHQQAVASEHVLLALLRVERGGAYRVLRDMGVQLEAARRCVKDSRSIQEFVPDNRLYTIEVRPSNRSFAQLLKAAKKQSKILGHACIASEHLLLGLLQLKPSEGGWLFDALRVDRELCRSRVLDEIIALQGHVPTKNN
jgi:ATP-dependent Clp protease ATP-binding subunit ClpC